MGIERSLFVGEVPLDCLCPVCQDVLEDPKETIVCQHAFCYPCITRWLQEHDSCPTCRCPLVCGDLVSLHRIWRDKLNHLKVRCRNYHVGCDKVLELENLGYHYSECSYLRVSCPNGSCTEVVLRSLLHDHLKVCDYRKITCHDCKLSIPALSLRDHKCIPALREDMQHRIELLRREWADNVRMMQKEQRKLEERVSEQSTEIADLRRAISILTAHRKVLPHIPTLGRSTGRISTRTHSHVPITSMPHASTTSRFDSGGTNLSLPRLAPLHTHMSLSRSSSGMCYYCACTGMCGYIFM